MHKLPLGDWMCAGGQPSGHRVCGGHRVLKSWLSRWGPGLNPDPGAHKLVIWGRLLTCPSHHLQTKVLTGHPLSSG